jgi:hypothetical protein
MLPLAAFAAAVTLAPQPLSGFKGWTGQDLSRYTGQLSVREQRMLIDGSAALFRHEALTRAAVELPRLFVSLDESDGSRPRLEPRHDEAERAVLRRSFAGEPRPRSFRDESDPRRWAPPRLTGQRFGLDPRDPEIDGGGPSFGLDAFPPCGLAGDDLHELLGTRLVAKPEAYWNEAKVHYMLARKLAPVVTLARKPDPFGERRYSYGGYFNTGAGDGLDAYDPAPPRESRAEPPESVEANPDTPPKRRPAPPARRDCRELQERPSLELLGGVIGRYASKELTGLPGLARLVDELGFADTCYKGAFPQLKAAATLLERLGEAAPALRAACAARQGRFAELRGGGNHVELLSCRDTAGTRLGASLRWYEDGRVTAAYALGEDELTLTGRFEERTIQLAGSFGPELLFDLDGRPALLRLEDGGPTVEWYASGRVLLLRDGNRETVWHPDGKGAIDFDLTKGGMPKRRRKWHPNARIAEDISFAGGKPHGTARWWHADGRVAGEARFVNGAPAGEARLYFEDGRLGFQARYAQGELAGLVRYLDRDGAALLTGTARDGDWDGPLEVRLNAALPLFSRRFARGKPTGTWTDFNPLLPGQPLRVVTLDARGLVTGRARGYSVGGSLKSECRIERSRLTKLRSWHQNGAPLARAVFDAKRQAFVVQVGGADKRPVFSCDGYKPRATGRCVLAPTRRETLPRISDTALFMHYAKQGVPVWRPEACGGYRAVKRETRLSLREYEKNQSVWTEKTSFETKGPCPDEHTAQLTCWVRYQEQGSTVHSCEAGAL